jgi:D-proline reductase (dithiol) PrdB
MIRYIERTRSYYAALGYPAYEWASFTDVPFSAPSKSLAESTLTLITTAAPRRPELGDQGPGAAYNAAAKFFRVYTAATDPVPDLRISHLGYDRRHSTAEDPNTWLPIAQLREAVADGRLGSLGSELIGVPTNRSQRVTSEQDATDTLAAIRDQHADLALLVPS